MDVVVHDKAYRRKAVHSEQLRWHYIQPENLVVGYSSTNPKRSTRISLFALITFFEVRATTQIF